MPDTYDIASQKAALRKEVLARRKAMSPAERAQKSAQINKEIARCLCQHFAENPPQSGPIVALFSSFGTEVDLRDSLTTCAEHGWIAALPVMFQDVFEAGAYMEFVCVPYEVALSRRADFLSHPARPILRSDFDAAAFPLVNPQEIDAMLIPLVAFDDAGGRLGYGGGNYDRYLPQLRPDCWCAGVAFAEQRVAQVPQAGFDLSIPRVISA